MSLVFVLMLVLLYTHLVDAQQEALMSDSCC